MFTRMLVTAVTVALVAPAAFAEILAKTYPVKDFSEFLSGGNTTVEISQGDTEYLRIEADSEVMPRVKVDQSGQRVSVWVKKEGGFFNWFGHSNESVRVVLQVKQLAYLELSGNAKATAADLQAKKLQTNISGAGEINFAALHIDYLKMDLSGAANVRIQKMNSRTQKFHLSGAADIEIQSASHTQKLDVDTSGASHFRGKNLTAKQAKLGASGASQINASVTETLDANASGASSIDYYGSPKAKTDASGASHVQAHPSE